MGLTLLVHADGPTSAPTLVVAAGPLDAHTAPQLREKLIDLISNGRHHLVLDLDGVHDLDPTGLGVLVGAVRRLHPHQGSLQLVCTQHRTVDVIMRVGLGGILPIHPTRVEATAVANTPPPATEAHTAAGP